MARKTLLELLENSIECKNNKVRDPKTGKCKNKPKHQGEPGYILNEKTGRYIKEQKKIIESAKKLNKEKTKIEILNFIM
jgi:hypothetical protein